MRFHIVGLPHTQTLRSWSWCAYTAKIVKFCGMLTSLGHEVFLYSGEQNDAVCTEHIPIVYEAEQRQWFSGYNWETDVFNGFDPGSPWWLTMNGRAVREIKKRAGPRDFVGIIAGWAQHELLRTGLVPLEWGVGYSGVLDQTHRCFESHAWAHHVAGIERRDDARFFDVVIPNSFEESDFPAGPGGRDFLFLGRLMHRKGPTIAAEACKRLGARLILAGQGVRSSAPGRVVAQDGTVIEGDVEHVGRVGPERRAELMGAARAVFVPTIYLEPFGGVAVEAMLCGTPVICSEWGAFTETVKHGVSGFLCRTLAEFVQAGKDAENLDRKAVREHALRYTTSNVRFEYNRWFKRLETLWDKGWYQE